MITRAAINDKRYARWRIHIGSSCEDIASAANYMKTLRGRGDVHGLEARVRLEFVGRRAIRKGDWKMTWEGPPYGNGERELFHLATDPSGTKDLSDEELKKVAELQVLWDDYATENGVILPTKDGPPP